MADTRSVLWVDAGAGTTITRINTLLGGAAITASLLSVSNADRSQSWEGPLTVNATPTPTAAQYQSVTQRVSLLFTTTAPGIMVTLTLVAPQLSIFLADQKTVDLTNGLIVTLAAVCVGNLCDEGGNAATALVAGFLNA